VAAATVSANDDQSRAAPFTSQSDLTLRTVESDWVAVSLSPVAPVALASTPIDSQHHQQGSGLMGQLGDLLAQAVVPLSRGGGLALGLIAGLRYAIIQDLVSIGLLMWAVMGAASYLSYLRRSGYAHAARSDADTAGTTNPATNGLLKRRQIGLVGGPFLVGLDNLMERR
jgi:hypothetical protein